jgi:hypothetical protein
MVGADKYVIIHPKVQGNHSTKSVSVAFLEAIRGLGHDIG